MDALEAITRLAGRVNPRLMGAFLRGVRSLPGVRGVVDRELDKLTREIKAMLGRGEDVHEPCVEIPEHGRGKAEILTEMKAIEAVEAPRWRGGYVSGAVYHGGDEHVDLLNRVYAINSQSNPLHMDLWPSATRFEAEIVAMTAKMLGAETREATAKEGDKVVGTVTLGGTDSILHAMKAYRDLARAERGIRRPEIIVPVSAHPAFDKAAHYFGMKIRHVPLGRDFRADVEATRKAVTRNTVVIVGSAPSFPHGVIDPIGELSELARGRGIGLHVDACLGGFILPWAEKLGYDIPPFDFRLPGVTSISADTHKFGYALKGSSVILYRGRKLARHQYFVTTSWPGGIYFTPTFAGSRPGALSAVCWAAMVSTGKDGYMEATRKILETSSFIRQGISEIPGLRVLGDPLWVIAFASDGLDIYEIMEGMSERQWNLNGLQDPPAVHICVTLRHTQPGVAERFLNDLRSAVEEIGARPAGAKKKIPLYGLAATFPERSMIRELLERVMETAYEA